ncbi:MAG: outer membrane beta-barrel family protein [Muribaculaceae bacterium]|nr:outer membrane beta-barrel family protein [Muribaculaceae bacterium]
MNVKFLLLLSGMSVMAQNAEYDELARTLQEVVVSADQHVTKLVGSTLVSKIVGSNLENLGNALDILGQLPMILVQNDEISVTGKNNVEIYIDGRPIRDNSELQQLLSTNIKTVELLMAPGAAYDSTTDAVLLITTRRRFVQGLSLTENFELQRRRKWSVTDYLNVTYRSGRFEFFANGTVNRNNSLIKGTTTNTLVYQGAETTIGSSQRSSYPTTTGVIKAGFSYSDASQSLGAYYRYNPERGNFSNSGSEWIDSAPAINRRIDQQIRSGSHLVSIYYENTFAGSYRLHFDGDFRQSRSRSRSATDYSESPALNVSSTDRRTSTLWAGKLYLTMPLLSGELTCGAQASLTRSRLDYKMQSQPVEQYIPSSLTDAKQTLAAMFASWARSFGKLSLSVGARYE